MSPSSKTGALRRHRPFLLIVVLPTLLVALYYALLASDQYASEAQFIVRSSRQGSAPVSGLGHLLGLSAGGMGMAQGETFAIADFLKSHDAVKGLQKQFDLVKLFRPPEADMVARLWQSNPAPEQLLRFYKKHVRVMFHEETGITTLRVVLFRPEDAEKVARALLVMGEERVNEFNRRALENTLKVANLEIERALQRVVDVQDQLTRFRTAERNINPEQLSKAGVMLLAQLQGQLAQADIQLSQLVHTVAPGSPQILALKKKIAALTRQIETQKNLLTNGRGALAPVMAEYEKLLLEQQFAQSNYNAAQAALENARLDALKQQLYVARVVDPNLPVLPTYPKGLLMTGTVFAVLFLVFFILRMTVVGIREHAI